MADAWGKMLGDVARDAGDICTSFASNCLSFLTFGVGRDEPKLGESKDSALANADSVSAEAVGANTQEFSPLSASVCSQVQGIFAGLGSMNCENSQEQVANLGYLNQMTPLEGMISANKIRNEQYGLAMV